MQNESKLLKIVLEPDPILHKVCNPVEHIDDITKDQLRQMTEIMSKLDCIGLAAPQVGLLKRMIVIDVETIAIEDKLPKPPQKYLKLINPEILKMSPDTSVREEGCLSLPSLYYKIERANSIELKYLNEQGEEINISADGLLARCIEHEIDHLNGKVLLDYISPLKKKFAIKKLIKIKG